MCKNKKEIYILGLEPVTYDFAANFHNSNTLLSFGNTDLGIF